jgi:DNA-binding transcriptional regulator YiaG
VLRHRITSLSQEEPNVAKIEMAIKETIQRGARRELRRVTVPLRREVHRLRRMAADLKREVAALKQVASVWARSARATSVAERVSEQEAETARLSAGLVRKLRQRLALSQAALARLTGVSAGAVVHWERGGATPSGEHRRALVGLRRLGRREVRRLLAAMPTAEKARRPRRAAGRRQRAKARRRATPRAS